MTRYELMYQDTDGRWKHAGGDHGCIDGVYKQAEKLFDTGVDGFIILETKDGIEIREATLPPHRLVKQKCPVCGQETRWHEMAMTRDCHGIPYRMVCSRCYDRIYYATGFDGVYYTEADECIDYSC